MLPLGCQVSVQEPAGNNSFLLGFPMAGVCLKEKAGKIMKIQ